MRYTGRGKRRSRVLPVLTLAAAVAAVIEARAKEIDALRNELCLKCGKYTLAHEGACNGCRWRG